MSTEAAGAAAATPDILDEVNALITSLQSHPDPDVVQQVNALLEGIDIVHRTALTHLMNGIRGMAGDAFINRLIGDPAIRLLVMSYDLIAVDRRLLTEEALDPVRGHLHAHGVDVELLEVVGGAVYVRLHGVAQTQLPVDAIRRDIESALKDGLIGFQQLELQAREQASGKLVQLNGGRRPRRPLYQDVAKLEDVEGAGLYAVETGDVPILLAVVEGDICAVRNRCGETPLPLQFSTLQGNQLRCSWHGCIYDVRTGQRMDGEGDAIAVYPVRIEGSQIQIAVTTEEQ